LVPDADEVLWGGALTPHQAAVLELVAAGLSNREVAGRLFMAEGTVKWHLRRASDRLGVTGRVCLARWWWLNVDLPRFAGVLELGAVT
jgi:DNA-binding NarL/FixJ family response regulator